MIANSITCDHRNRQRAVTLLKIHLIFAFLAILGTFELKAKAANEEGGELEKSSMQFDIGSEINAVSRAPSGESLVVMSGFGQTLTSISAKGYTRVLSTRAINRPYTGRSLAHESEDELIIPGMDPFASELPTKTGIITIFKLNGDARDYVVNPESDPNLKAKGYVDLFSLAAKGRIAAIFKGMYCSVDLPSRKATLYDIMIDPILSASNKTLPKSFVTSIDQSRDGRLVAIGTDSGTIILLDARSGREMYRHQAFPLGEQGVHQEGVQAISFSPDGSRLAVGRRALLDPVTVRTEAGPKLVYRRRSSQYVKLFNLGSGVSESVSFDEDEQSGAINSVNWIEWINEERLVLATDSGLIFGSMNGSLIEKRERNRDIAQVRVSSLGDVAFVSRNHLTLIKGGSRAELQ